MPSRTRSSPPKGKHVVIIGGGDTGADCLGTAHRQGARSVHQFELLPRPPEARARRTIRGRSGRTSSARSAAHEEGGERVFSVSTERFTGDGTAASRRSRRSRSRCVREDGPPAVRAEAPAREFELEADLVLLAMGFLGPERNGLLDELGVRSPSAATSGATSDWMTSVPGVFTAGDMQRGQSLIVWAIADGRQRRARRRHLPDGALGAA